jgi:hypothetical protein
MVAALHRVGGYLAEWRWQFGIGSEAVLVSDVAFPQYGGTLA